MRRMLLLLCGLCFLLPVAAGRYRVDEIPNVQRADRTRYTSDPDGILAPATVARIDSLCDALRRREIAQVAVVAVDDIEGDDLFDFAIELFSQWGVGQAGSDNGLGILLVRGRREIRFVTGGGLEGVLPDAICKRIQLNYMLPAFREGDYDAGMVAGVAAVARLLEGEAPDSEWTEGEEDLPFWGVLLVLAAVIGIPLAIVFVVFYFNQRCPKCHAPFAFRQQSSSVVATTADYRLIRYTCVCSRCGHTRQRTSKQWRSDRFDSGGGGPLLGGGFGGRGGGFGGGGFGGGSFGGGGAGSRW